MAFDTHGVPVGRSHSFPQQLTVLVTGAASGIGLAQTRLFLQEGHQVFAVDRNESEHFPLLADRYPATFGFAVADISFPESVTGVFKQLEKRFGLLHVLCNTAGQLDGYKTIADTTFEEWTQLLRNNLDSVFLMTKNALPLLLANPSSRIINMASIAGLTAGGGGVSYTSSKHAIVGLTKQLAYDYSSRGLRVNAIAPGAIATPMNTADFLQDNGKMAQWVAEETPTKRWAHPEEIAELTLFLASDRADYIQGATIPVDGGWMIR